MFDLVSYLYTSYALNDSLDALSKSDYGQFDTKMTVIGLVTFITHSYSLSIEDYPGITKLDKDKVTFLDSNWKDFYDHRHRVDKQTSTLSNNVLMTEEDEKEFLQVESSAIKRLQRATQADKMMLILTSTMK